MNILVCFIAAPNLDKLIDEDWVIDKNLQIDTSFPKPVLSSYDESGLEIALKLSDASEGVKVSIDLKALTIAGTAATALLKTLNALPFKQVVRIDSHDDSRFRPRAIASILSQYVSRHAPQDVLFLGRQSSVGENAKTQLLVAEMLAWPCITQVTGVELMDENHLLVTSQLDNGQIQQQIQTPCVLSIGDAPNTFMRVPTLKERIRYGQRPIEVISITDFQLPDETETLMDLEIISHERQGIFIEGETPEQKVRELYEVYLKERLEKL